MDYEIEKQKFIASFAKEYLFLELNKIWKNGHNVNHLTRDELVQEGIKLGASIWRDSDYSK